MKQYHDLLQHVLDHGKYRDDRTGTGTYSVFGYQMRFDLQDGFPLLTTKKLHIPSIFHEVLWYLQGDGSIKYLLDNNVKIWSAWVRPYSLDRKLVRVQRRIKPHSPYAGGFSTPPFYKVASEIDKHLIEIWVRMMRRCYDRDHNNYRFYGAKGISVDSAWHDPAVFLEDVKRIPHWRYKELNRHQFELDKDYYGSNQYGPETTVWLNKKENNSYMSSVTPVEATTPDGIKLQFVSINDAARSVGISGSALHRIIRGENSNNPRGNNKRFVGWDFSLIDVGEDIMRLELIEGSDLGPVYPVQWRKWRDHKGNEIDQIANVISEIKRNPSSRRLMVNAWNVGDLPDMALPPCHFAFQFYVDDGKLSCQLYQRSADTVLGTPFNLAAYALLTEMIAHVTELEVGELIVAIGDAHLYADHVEQAKLQLTREPYPLPQLRIKRKVTDIDDFKYEDFEVVGYQAHPHIKARVSV